MFCPYSGEEHADDEASDEHVVPYSVGGSNAFSIRVSRRANNRAGEEVDSLLTNNFFIAAHRIGKGLVGQSGRSPSYKLFGTIDVDGKSVKSRYTVGDVPQLWLRPEVTSGVDEDGNECVTIACDVSDLARIIDDINRKLVARGKAPVDRDAFLKSAKIVSDDQPQMKVSDAFDVTSFERPFIKMALGAAHFALGEDYSRTKEASRLRAALWEPNANGRARLRLHGCVWPNVTGPGHEHMLKMIRRRDQHVVALSNAGPLAAYVVLFGEFQGMIKLCEDSARYRQKIGEGVAYVLDPITRRLSTHDYRQYLAANVRSLQHGTSAVV